VAQNALAFAIRDKFPVSQGHTLVIPRRVVETWFDASREEQAAIFELVEEVKKQLDEELRPDGYNVGFNAGVAAGQTVMHLHVHVIPRFNGDMEDPRGGVRHVIPEKGNYLVPKARRLATGGTQDAFLRHIEPLFATADEIAIVAAFMQESGVHLLRSHIFQALERGAAIQLLTGDYLHITKPSALERLLDWMDICAALAAEGRGIGRGLLEARIVEADKLAAPTRSFHPKSWRFEGPGFGVAFVGSSNVSSAALKSGVEWNLRLDRVKDATGYQEIKSAFERLWESALPLTAAWVQAYARARREMVALLPIDAEDESLDGPREPHEIQRAALAALAQSRDEEGHRRAMVVLATGLGKTWLAAFDVAAFAERAGRLPRVLFLAHREELLEQAADTFHRLFQGRDARFGFFVGGKGALEGDIVFASVQKLSRREHIERLDPTSFDYVIVDEVHHGAAPSYRRVLDRLEPRFLLGLTATPNRADGGDVLGLFDDHIAFEANIGEGIERSLLVPFAYHGLKDDVDYQQIPWRNQRFDPEALATAVDNDRRLEQMWSAWGAHPGARTLVFCCSIQHAEHTRAFLESKGVRARAVHSGPNSAPRDAALTGLGNGEVDALCAVDLFNEGIDVPAIDRVVMLRPTESSVIFLQQLGRGLRVAGGKRRLVVLDFVGNHRVFLDRIRMLVSLGKKAITVRDFLEGRREAPLPPGCTVDIELEAKDLLRKLLKPGSKVVVQEAYRDIAAARGERPTAGELFRMGYDPKDVRTSDKGFFDFVREEEDLTEAEKRVLEHAGAWLRDLEVTPMTRCFKMVTLEALMESDALFTGMPMGEIARRSHAILARSPELFKEIENVKTLPNPHDPDPKTLMKYWRANPLSAWSNADEDGKAWFAIKGDRFVSRLPCPVEDQATLAAMTRELVDYRLAQYRARAAKKQEPFEAAVVLRGRDPALRLPSKKSAAGLPSGDVDVRMSNGDAWRFRFTKEHCEAAHRLGSERNELPDLLRRWFGPRAGQPGNSFNVRFSPSPEGLTVESIEPIEPAGAKIIPFPQRRALTAYPTLRAAAGAPSDAREADFEVEQLQLPIKS